MSHRLYFIAVLAGLSVAQARAADNQTGYLISGQNSAPVTSGYGGCVHTLEWTADMSYRQCDPRPAVVEVPAPVKAVEAAPEPAVVVVQEAVVVEAPRPVPFRISMDALFDFDRSVLRADAGPALDQLAKDLTGADYQKVEIVGHADRIGAVRYNQKLSEQRAKAVREYLSGHGIDGAKITAAGVGKSEPVTGDLCKGVRGKRLVSCLQPDRFAEVTVTGTQTQAER